jgi:hypothetical protein
MKIRNDTLLNLEGTFAPNKNNFCYRVPGVLESSAGKQFPWHYVKMLVWINGCGSSRKCIKYNAKFDVPIVMAVNDMSSGICRTAVHWLLGQCIVRSASRCALIKRVGFFFMDHTE